MSMVSKLNVLYDEQAHIHPNPFAVETARAMMQAYLARWEKEDANTKVRGIETAFCLELPVPANLPSWCKPTKPRYIGGVIDSIIERDGKIMLTDMKTASQINDAYFNELYTNPQLTQYALALFACGHDNVSIEWDVVQKSSTKPKQLTKAAIADIESGHYCSWPVDVEVPDDKQETPYLWGRRLWSWYLDRPDHFVRRSFDRNAKELLDFLFTCHEVQSQMETLVKRGGDHIYLQRNHFSCRSYGTLCEFSPICSNFDPDRLGFKERTKREGVAETGVTPSQTGLFKQCGQKWWFKYQDKIEPKFKPRVDALALGSLVHLGRERILLDRLEDPIVMPLEKGAA